MFRTQAPPGNTTSSHCLYRIFYFKNKCHESAAELPASALQISTCKTWVSPPSWIFMRICDLGEGGERRSKAKFHKFHQQAWWRVVAKLKFCPGKQWWIFLNMQRWKCPHHHIEMLWVWINYCAKMDSLPPKNLLLLSKGKTVKSLLQ